MNRSAKRAYMMMTAAEQRVISLPSRYGAIWFRDPVHARLAVWFSSSAEFAERGINAFWGSS
jgi:hypothetical protein